MVTEVDKPVNMDMRVAGAHKALVTASDVTDKGHVIVLSKFGSGARSDGPDSQGSCLDIRLCTEILAVHEEWRLHMPRLVPWRTATVCASRNEHLFGSTSSGINGNTGISKVASPAEVSASLQSSKMLPSFDPSWEPHAALVAWRHLRTEKESLRARTLRGTVLVRRAVAHNKTVSGSARCSTSSACAAALRTYLRKTSA